MRKVPFSLLCPPSYGLGYTSVYGLSSAVWIMSDTCTQNLGSPTPGSTLVHGLLGTGPHSRWTVDFHETSPWCQRSWGPLFWSLLILIIWPPPQGEPWTLNGELSFTRSPASCYWHKSKLSAVYIIQIDLSNYVNNSMMWQPFVLKGRVGGKLMRTDHILITCNT